RRRLFLALHIQRVDVDDARELADSIEKGRQVVIGPIELEGDRPFRVQLFGNRGPRLEALDREIRLRGDRLHSAQQVGRVFLFRQNGFQADEPRFELRNLTLEFRQLPRGGQTLVDVRLQGGQLRLARNHFGARGTLVIPPEAAAAADRQHHEGSNLPPPRKFCQTDIHLTHPRPCSLIPDCRYPPVLV